MFVCYTINDPHLLTVPVLLLIQLIQLIFEQKHVYSVYIYYMCGCILNCALLGNMGARPW